MQRKSSLLILILCILIYIIGTIFFSSCSIKKRYIIQTVYATRITKSHLKKWDYCGKTDGSCVILNGQKYCKGILVYFPDSGYCKVYNESEFNRLFLNKRGFNSIMNFTTKNNQHERE